MPTRNIQAKDFTSREDIEKYIKTTEGVDLATNTEKDVKIKGKREELKVLYLTDETSVFGIRCEITDDPTSARRADKKTKLNARKAEFGNRPIR